MLTTLSRIIQSVNAAKDLDEVLSIVVAAVNQEIGTEICSIYLTDYKTSEHVLVATLGLNADIVGKLRFKLGEGLVGQVIERAESINLADAQIHPKFTKHPELGEERLHAYLGVPIIHQRRVLGVLVVQQETKRDFDEEEEAFLVTLCAQLSGIIAHALAIGTISAFTIAITQGMTFSGVPSAAGVCLGQAVVVYPLADLDAVPSKTIIDINKELSLLHTAMHAARKDINRLHDELPDTLGDEEKILFDAYIRILDSNSLIQEIEAEIRAGEWAQGSIRQVIKRYIARFENMDDEYLKERASDFKELGERVLSHLQASEHITPDYPLQTILIGEDVSPAALVAVPEDRLAGVVSVHGSSNSHVAILARALGVPTVMGANGIPLSEISQQEVIVDGYYGEVYVAPTPETRKEFVALIAEERMLDQKLSRLRDLPAKTTDGYEISLFVNTGLAADISRALTVGAEGVGLYRTEVPFLLRDRFPSEEEQRVIYRQLLQAFQPRPVIMRTLDIGGDKKLSYFPVEEDNPFLGWRGIRIMLDHPEIFLLQIRAMLRASIGYNNLHIMLPMITNVAEIEEALRLWGQAYDELINEGIDVHMPTFGAMIEVPASVYQADVIARRVDFLSVGSNDLTQYLLAVDRNNPRVSNLYDGLHPAVIQSLVQVVNAGHRAGKRVSICGEMAGDPVSVILLMAIGFDALSMSASRLPRVKWVVRKFTMKAARRLLKEVLAMDDPIEIREHLELALDEAGLGGLIRAGK